MVSLCLSLPQKMIYLAGWCHTKSDDNNNEGLSKNIQNS